MTDNSIKVIQFIWLLIVFVAVSLLVEEDYLVSFRNAYFLSTGAVMCKLYDWLLA